MLGKVFEGLSGINWVLSQVYIYPSSVEFLKNRPGFVLGHFRKMVLAPHLITETFRNSNNCNRTQFEGK